MDRDPEPSETWLAAPDVRVDRNPVAWLHGASLMPPQKAGKPRAATTARTCKHLRSALGDLDAPRPEHG